MNAEEYLYRILLRLYPVKYRADYGPLMVQHARDLGYEARQRGRSHVVSLWLFLIVDGIANALVAHRETLLADSTRFKPIPWSTIMLLVLPGLWIAFSRRHADVFGSLLDIMGAGYVLLFTLGLSYAWLRKRPLPLWALIFAGILAWYLTSIAARELLQQVGLLHIFGVGNGIVLLNIALATILFSAMLRGHNIPVAVWVFIGFIVMVNVLGAIISGQVRLVDGLQIRRLIQSLLGSQAMWIESLLIVGLGLLAARQHGVLAILFVVGGFSYIFIDTDYLYGYPLRDWSGLPLYLVAVSFLVLVLMPIAFLRARTKLARALVLFIPAVLFLAGRLIVPVLVLSWLMPGDVIISLNVLFSLILAWFLYSHTGRSAGKLSPTIAVRPQ